ncbi:MAG TPA: SRPBCC domain-containing protein [Geminicoccus sp.]|jgi:uncharacterized protein YndB with AHSA1/START domain|uniref:SRPBCC family protein n=1 Tax=Geminicoccus sp. TaxID=2024832 RepID=UPI002E2FCBF2|nr:SRPBCC domain-containing protein [Geminicoccus sp.]HEX2525811.1 SRPBCC domain-containing protein [Geminicoccus sp.]
MSTRPSLTIRRRLKAAPAKVWSAWTEPEHLRRWFGPDGGPTLIADVDVREGGRFHMAFHTEDGERHDVSGVYREVIPHEKLVFSWGWRTMPERESQVTLTLTPDADGTVLTLLHEQLFDEAVRDAHQQGWSGALDKLEAYVAQ